MEQASRRPPIRTLLAVMLLIVLGAALGWFIASPHRSADPGQTLGANDFIAYWAAFQVARRGGNPYSAQELFAVQQGLFPGLKEARQYWNPPWTLTMMSPVLALPFDYARSVWVLLNIFFLTASGVLVWQLASPGRINLLWCFTATVVFVPAWSAVSIGQLSLFAVFGLCGFLWCLNQAKPKCAGLMLVFALAKPHPFYLLLLFILLVLFRPPLRRILGAACLYCAALYSLTFLFLPQSFFAWNSSANLPLHWKTATLATQFRILLASQDGAAPAWPVLAFPLAGIILFCLWYAARKAPALSLRTIIPVLCFSLLTAPYAWVFDYSALLIAQVALIAASSAQSARAAAARELACWLLLLQAGLLLMSHLSGSMHVEVWFPLAMLAIWLRGASLLARDNQAAFSTSINA